ncbi:MAG: prephenate dehydrogenase/arogenate dehydrogenase family protein [Chloroflexi bacterium]|nr:prephenate dehydrogenase/arogenate dehydrogenase family protein [Chloroflexota bacterium]
MDKIAIIGLGLIGGSIGMALKGQKNPNLQVVGFDLENSVGNKAVKRGAVDKAVWQLPEAVEGAQIVIIATPVLAIRDMLQTIAGMVSRGCIVTDTGGTKRAVMDWAEEYLPEGVSFIGGNPMAGKDMAGIDKASPDLFRNARYALIPGKGAPEAAVQAIVTLVEGLKATPFFVDAYEHDSHVAAVSHLPILLAEALVSATSKSPAWREISRMAASGYESTSVLAGSDPLTNLDMCITNREAVVHWANEAIRELVRLRDLVNGAGNEAGAEALGTALAKSWEAREIWHTKYLSGDFSSDDAGPRTQMPSPGELLADFMVGARIRERYQQMFNISEKKEQERRQRRFRKT